MGIFDEIGDIASGVVHEVEAVGHAAAAGVDAITGDSDAASDQLSQAGADAKEGFGDVFGERAEKAVFGIPDDISGQPQASADGDDSGDAGDDGDDRQSDS